MCVVLCGAASCGVAQCRAELRRAERHGTVTTGLFKDSYLWQRGADQMDGRPDDRMDGRPDGQLTANPPSGNYIEELRVEYKCQLKNYLYEFYTILDGVQRKD